MARTFTYDKRQRTRQQPTLRSTWRNATEITTRRGKYADIADRVREHRLSVINRITDRPAERRNAQKLPVSD